MVAHELEEHLVLLGGVAYRRRVGILLLAVADDLLKEAQGVDERVLLPNPEDVIHAGQPVAVLLANVHVADGHAALEVQQCARHQLLGDS